MVFPKAKTELPEIAAEMLIKISGNDVAKPITIKEKRNSLISKKAEILDVNFTKTPPLFARIKKLNIKITK